MFSAIFIRRPILASVISIIITLAGLAAIKALPIEQFPEVVPPVISVTANYPGASAEVVADTVAAPLEQAINGVDHMLYVQSNSSNGELSLNVTFAIGTNPEQATIDVNNRVQSVLAQLPDEVRRQGVSVNKRTSAFLQVLALYSPDKRYDTLFISNYASLNVIDALKRVPGVGDVVNFAGQDYSMRVWLKPDRMAQLKITTQDIASAVQEQNAQFAPGQIGAEPMNKKQAFTYTITAQGRLSTPEEFGDIILRSNPDGSAVRLKDVAKIELGALSYGFNGEYNGQPAIPVGIFLAPGANQLATAQAVNKTMAELSKSFPSGLSYYVPFDTTRFVDISIKEVYSTLIEALVLVFAVVYLFLQNWRATLIPFLAVPVSIIGTFAGIYLLGFSINTLTLFGLVLAIGIVIDDAIVVLENVERLMSEKGLSPVEASLQAMREVSGALVAIVLVLCSVFIPVAFTGGIAGQMYKQFATTIAIAVVISGIVALTLTPALCALILKHDQKNTFRFFQIFNRWFAKATRRYSSGVQFFLKRSALGLSIFVVIIVVSAGLFKMVPSSLAPSEDQGYILAISFLPDGASLQRTKQTMEQLDTITRANPAVLDVMTFAGFDLLSGGPKTNAGVSFIMLKPWDQRKAPGMGSEQVAQSIMQQGMMRIRDGIVLTFNPPPISGMSNTGGFEAYVQNRGAASVYELENVTKQLVAAASKRPELQGLNSSFSANTPQISVQLDREKARALNVPIDAVFGTMQSTFGSLYVNDFNKFGRTFRVLLQSEPDFRSTIEDLNKVFVRSQTGEMIPLSSLVTAKKTTGADTLERFNLFPAAKIIGSPNFGYSSGQALSALEQVAHEVLPAGYTLAWTGSAYQEKSAAQSPMFVFAFGLIMIFLILAALYERWSLPISVLITVPFAIFGALAANWIRDLYNDIYFQVALVTLVGLSAKNAILIVEFAVQQMDAGKDIVHAAISAAKLRFRPIIMTSLAFICGCLPLAYSSGAGSASRHSIGTGVIGGMLAATFIATFFIPMFFMLIMKLAKAKPKVPSQPKQEGEQDHV